MSDKAENLSRARVIARVIAKEDCRSKGGKINDHYCSILLSELNAKDARIAELEEKIERLTNFCTSAIYKDESDAPEVLELNLIALLAKGGE